MASRRPPATQAPVPHGRGGLTLACRLLPREVRADVIALYGVFRVLDDLVDHHDARAADRVEAVEAWCQDRRARSPETATLAAVGERRPLPVDAVGDFCRGMRDDLAGSRPATEADVDRYCYRVAGTVGVVVASLLGSRRPCLDAAATLGIAMQRTNILRDIDEDAAAGRVYLARETTDRFGGARPGRRAALVRDQIARADALYDRGTAGIGALRRGRPAIAAAAGTYREILRQIEREGHGAHGGRAVVSRPRQLAAAARAWALHGRAEGESAPPPREPVAT